MFKIKNVFSIMLSLVLSIMSFITQADGQNIEVTNSYARETIPGTNVSSAYMKITNLTGKSVTLVGVSSKISERIEIHEHIMSDGMMNMRQKESLVINSKDAVTLQPSGLHLMIFDIKQPLKDGELITLILHFSSQPDVTVQIPVQSIKRK